MTQPNVREILEKLKPHYACEDTWYECRALDGCNPDAGPEGVCDCGRDKAIDLALSELIKLIEGIEPFDICDGKDLIWKDSVINLLKG